MARPARRLGGARYGRARGAPKKPEKEVWIIGSPNAVGRRVWRRGGAGTPLNHWTGSPASRGERPGSSGVLGALCRRARAARGMGRKRDTEGAVQCPSVSLEKTGGRIGRRVLQGAPARRWRLPIFVGFWGFLAERLGRPGARAGHRLLAGHSATAPNGACVPAAAVATRRNAARGCQGVGPSWCCGFGCYLWAPAGPGWLGPQAPGWQRNGRCCDLGILGDGCHGWLEKCGWLRARLATCAAERKRTSPPPPTHGCRGSSQHGVALPTGLRRRPCHECHIPTFCNHY